MSEQTKVSEEGDASPPSYEPPGVETVLSPGQLEREVLYAGPLITGDPA